MKIVNVNNDKITLEVTLEELSIINAATNAVSNSFDETKDYMLTYTEQDVERIDDQLQSIYMSVSKNITNEDLL